MSASVNCPIRTNPINKVPSFTTTQLVRSVDRIQLSVRNRKDNYDLVLKAFEESLDFVSNTREPFKGGYRIKWIYKLNENRVYLIHYGAHWFSILVVDPDDNVQLRLRDLIVSVVSPNDVSVSQVEFALDFYPDDPTKVDDLFATISHHVVLKRLRAGGAKRKKTTHYQGRKGNVRKGPYGIRVYPKTEHGHRFVRVELQANKPLLKRNGFSLLSFPISPDDLDVLDYVTFRRKFDLDAVSQRHAQSRNAKLHYDCPRRMAACYRTSLCIARGIFSRALKSNLRYEIEELTAAEQIAALKAKLSPRIRFVLRLNRHFPAYPKGGCGNVRWKA